MEEIEGEIEKKNQQLEQVGKRLWNHKHTFIELYIARTQLTDIALEIY